MKLIKKLEGLFAASAFAEEGEFDSARQILSGEEKPGALEQGQAGSAGRCEHCGSLTSRPVKA